MRLIILFNFLLLFSQQLEGQKDAVIITSDHYTVTLDNQYIDSISNGLIDSIIMYFKKKWVTGISREKLCVNNNFIDTIHYTPFTDANLNIKLLIEDEDGNLVKNPYWDTVSVKSRKEVKKFYYFSRYNRLYHKDTYTLKNKNTNNCEYDVFIERFYETDNILHTCVFINDQKANKKIKGTHKLLWFYNDSWKENGFFHLMNDGEMIMNQIFR